MLSKHQGIIWTYSDTVHWHKCISRYSNEQHLVCVNSLAPGKFKWNFRHVIFKQILVIGGWGISCEIALIYMSPNFPDDQSTLLQVMAWCHQAASHYLSQCWSGSLLPNGITRPQWVNSLINNTSNFAKEWHGFLMIQSPTISIVFMQDIACSIASLR